MTRVGVCNLYFIILSISFFSVNGEAVYRSNKVNNGERARWNAADAVRPTISTNGAHFGKQPVLCKFLLSIPTPTSLVKPKGRVPGRTVKAHQIPIIDPKVARPPSPYTTQLAIGDFVYKLETTPSDRLLLMSTVSPLLDFSAARMNLTFRLPENPIALHISEVGNTSLFSSRARLSPELDVLRKVKVNGIPEIKILRPPKSPLRPLPPPIAIGWSAGVKVATKGLIEREMPNVKGRQTFENELVVKFEENGNGGYSPQVESLTGVFPSLFNSGYSYKPGSYEIVDGMGHLQPNHIPALPPFMVEIYPMGNKTSLVFDFTAVADANFKLPHQEGYKETNHGNSGNETLRKLLYKFPIETGTIQHIEFDPVIEVDGPLGNAILRVKIYTEESMIDVDLFVNFDRNVQTIDPKAIFSDLSRGTKALANPANVDTSFINAVPFEYKYPEMEIIE